MVTYSGLFASFGVFFFAVGVMGLFLRDPFDPLAFGIGLLVTAYMSKKEEEKQPDQPTTKEVANE